MLPVFHALPVAAPLKARLGKKLIHQVVVVDFVGEIFASVEVGRPVERLDIRLSLDGLVIRIVARVYVHRQALPVL